MRDIHKLTSNKKGSIEDNKSVRTRILSMLKEEEIVARNRSVMSEELKAEFAKELGVYDTVKKEGWGNVSSRDCGNLVRMAIEKANRDMNNGPQK